MKLGNLAIKLNVFVVGSHRSITTYSKGSGFNPVNISCLVIC